MTDALKRVEAEAAATATNVQPLIVNVLDTEDYYVVVDSYKYVFPSAVRALDILFKLTMVFNLAYSREAKNFLLFIQRFVFDIKTKYDKLSPCIFDVSQKLKDVKS